MGPPQPPPSTWGRRLGKGNQEAAAANSIKCSNATFPVTLGRNVNFNFCPFHLHRVADFTWPSLRPCQLRVVCLVCAARESRLLHEGASFDSFVVYIPGTRFLSLCFAGCLSGAVSPLLLRIPAASVQCSWGDLMAAPALRGCGRAS